MGNSSGLLANYSTTIGSDPIEYSSSPFCTWTISDGTKKDEAKEMKDRDKISILKSPKFSGSNTVGRGFAVKHIQRLRNIRHPFVVTYYDSAEMDECQVVVTEQSTPLAVWLNNAKLQVGTSESDRTQELIWGFRCVLMALDFLHNNCNLLHGNISINSIFVSVSGDWKIGGLELASNVSQDEEMEYFVSNHHLLNKLYCSPERLQINGGGSLSDVNTSILRAKLPPYYIDVFSLGHTMQTAFYTLDIPLPKSLSRYVSPMISPDMKKRPTCAKLLTGSIFRSDQVQLLESIDELSVKTSRDALDSLSKLEPSVSQVATSICSNKVVPAVGRILSQAVTDFGNRDHRETCRQAVVTCVNLLSKLASLHKLDDIAFSVHVGSSVATLFSLTDRTVRTVLLQGLRHIGRLLSREAVNKTIFDQMVSGFSDSNSTLRENTLMGLLHLVDKLDDSNLQDKLVRCVVNLQNDSEPSIRTNATIFLGKVAVRLREAVRHKVLCTSFSKAMKDNFLHCRIAGLKASAACIKLMDLPQLTTKVLPQAAILVLDKSNDVRSLSISLLEACTDCLKLHHQSLLAAAAAATTSTSTSSTEAQQQGDNNNNSNNNNNTSNKLSGSDKDMGWGVSWSVLQNISKSIEVATAIDHHHHHPIITTITSSSSSSSSSANNVGRPPSPPPAMVYRPEAAGKRRKAAAARDDWENELDGLALDDDDDDNNNNNNNKVGKGKEKSIDEELPESDDEDDDDEGGMTVVDRKVFLEVEEVQETKKKGWEEF